jgi:prophage regulatory protein
MPDATGLPNRLRVYRGLEKIMSQVIDRRTDAILRLPQVRQITGLGRSSIYALQEIRAFPHSIKLSPRAVGWLESEVRQWIHSRVEQRGIQSSQDFSESQEDLGVRKRRVAG